MKKGFEEEQDAKAPCPRGEAGKGERRMVRSDPGDGRYDELAAGESGASSLK